MKLSTKLWISSIVSSVVAIILFVALALTLGKTMHTGYTYETLTVMATELIVDVKQSEVKETTLNPIMNAYQSEHPCMYGLSISTGNPGLRNVREPAFIYL